MYLTPPPGGTVVSTQELGHILQVGFLRQQKRIKITDTIASTEAGKFLKEFDPNGTKFNKPKNFVLVNPDFQCEKNQLMLLGSMTNERPLDIPQDVDRKAMRLLSEFYHRAGVFSSVIPVEEVMYNPDGSCGYILNRIYRSKGEFVKHGGLLVDYPWYRKNAHVENIPQLFMSKAKKELLTKAKADEKNTRLYEFSNVYHFFSTAQDNQAFNKRLYKLKQFNAVGSSFQRGGFHELITRLERFRNRERHCFFTGDVSKWDKRFRTKLKNRCRRLRVGSYRGTDQEYPARMRYQYRQEKRPYLLISSGQVVQPAGHQPSGVTNTTSDNVIGHQIIMFGFVIHMCDDDGKMTLDDVLNILIALLYADDQICSLHDDYVFLSSFDSRREFYARMGMSLKKEDDRVQDTVIGLVFLGAEVAKYGGYYVPKYNAERLEASITIQKEALDIQQEFAKVFAIYALAAFCGNDSFLDNLYDYLVFLHYKSRGYMALPTDADDDDLVGVLSHVKHLKLNTVPSLKELREYFWLGLESSTFVIDLEVMPPDRSIQLPLSAVDEHRPTTRKLLWQWLECWKTSILNL